MSRTRRIQRAVLLAAVATLLGCDGQIADPTGSAGSTGRGGGSSTGPGGGGGGGGGPGGTLASCDVDGPGRTPVRVMSEAEWENTVRDLLGSGGIELTASPSTGAYDFDNDARDLSVPPAVADAYLAGAQEAAAVLRSQLDDRLECDRAEGRPCAAELLRTFGRRAYRRPLTDGELDDLLALWDLGGSFDEGIELATQAMLVSAPFLYRVEIGVPDDTGRRRLTGWEVATRLSYFLWASTPDDGLLDAAAAGELDTPEGIRAQAERMLEDPRAHRSVRHLHRQWLELDRIDGATRDPALFPGFDAELQDGLKEETLAFVEELVFGGGRVSELLDSDFTMMNGRVAEFYGVAGVTGPEMRRVPLDTTERAGLLTQAGIMAARASYDRTSIVKRGAFVRRKILCQTLPSPPPDVPRLPEPEEGETERERLSRHRSDPVCASCHTLIDPLGFPFEHYDAAGQYRENDFDGRPVDASGEITATTDADGPVGDALELSHRLARSDEVEQCVIRQWFRYAVGRSDGDDQCRVRELHDELGHDFRLRDMVLAIVTSDPFRYRDGGDVEATCE